MSQIPSVLNLTESDVRKMLACNVHLGSRNVTPQMTRYVWKRNVDGVHIIDLRKTWEKLVLAARVIVSMEPQDVCAVALTVGQSKAPPIAQRAVLKFSQYVGSKHIVGKFTPGTFTNRIQSNFIEPRLLVVSDPVKDFQPILESSYVNMPVIAFSDVDGPSKHVDIVIPCNTRSPHSVALVWWMLSREVRRLKGNEPRNKDWGVMVDMFLYRDPEAEEKTEKRGTSNQDQYVQEVWKNKDHEEGHSSDDRVGVEETDFTDQTPNTNEVGEPKKGSRDWADWDKDQEEVIGDPTGNEGDDQNQSDW